jgi:hypothetical protein
MKAKYFAFLVPVCALMMSGFAAWAAEGGCATLCKDCATMCQKNLSYMQKKGGKHADPARVNAMKDCIKICDTNHDFLSRKSEAAVEVDKACSTICSTCATKCEELKDPKLKDCVAMCKKCATACEKHEK